MREHFEKLYSKKLDNQEETDTVLEICNLWRLNHVTIKKYEQIYDQ